MTTKHVPKVIVTQQQAEDNKAWAMYCDIPVSLLSHQFAAEFGLSKGRTHLVAEISAYLVRLIPIRSNIIRFIDLLLQLEERFR
jgi:hypothetical protein